MDEFLAKITEFLSKNPNHRAKLLARELGVDKSAINKCLYANAQTHFLKQGETPPLWRNVGNQAHSGDTPDNLEDL